MLKKKEFTSGHHELTAISLVADIEAQIRDIQSRKKEIVNEEGVTEKDRVGLGESGYFDRDIYDSSGGKYDGYVTSIAANDEVDVSNLFYPKLK